MKKIVCPICDQILKVSDNTKEVPAHTKPADVPENPNLEPLPWCISGDEYVSITSQMIIDHPEEEED